jgi:DnaJ-class molecular chaperone
MNQIDEEEQLKHLEPRKCHTCNGKGKYNKYIPVPGGTLQKVEVTCQMCEGRGSLDMIDEIDSSSKTRV